MRESSKSNLKKLKEMSILYSHLSQKVISADQIPVPHLHTQQTSVSQRLVQLKLKTLVPPWVTGLFNHLEEAGSWQSVTDSSNCAADEIRNIQRHILTALSYVLPLYRTRTKGSEAPLRSFFARSLETKP